MSSKNKKIAPSHVARVVRRVWTLWFVWLKSESDVDKQMYLAQRALAETAIAALPTEQRVDFTLP